MLHYSRSGIVRAIARRRDLRTKTPGNIDEATFVDGAPGLVVQRFATDIPRGAPFYVRGWAVDLGRCDVPWDLRVEVDGKEMPARIGRGEVRPDIVRFIGSAAVLGCGFEATFETGTLSVGPHDLGIRAIVGRRGTAFARIPSTIRFFIHDRYPERCAPPGAAGAAAPWCSIDAPTEVPTGSILVASGWAFDKLGRPFAAVAARIDEEPWAAGWIGGSTAFAPAISACRGLTRAGFCVRMRLDTILPGGHTLRLAGRTVDGLWLALGSPLRVIVTSVDMPAAPRPRMLCSGGDAVITSIDGTSDAGWLVHPVGAGSMSTIRGILRRSSPSGTPIAIVARCVDGSEASFPAWSAPTSDLNVVQFGARIGARALRPGRHVLFVEAPDALGRAVGRADTGTQLEVDAGTSERRDR